MPSCICESLIRLHRIHGVQRCGLLYSCSMVRRCAYEYLYFCLTWQHNKTQYYNNYIKHTKHAHQEIFLTTKVQKDWTIKNCTELSESARQHVSTNQSSYVSVGHDREPCKNWWTDLDVVWDVDSGGPKRPCIRWRPGSPLGRSNFEDVPCGSSVQIAAATLSGNSFRQTVQTHRASVHQAVKLVAALLRVAGVTVGLVESNGSRVCDSRHLQADCQELGSAPEPYAR